MNERRLELLGDAEVLGIAGEGGDAPDGEVPRRVLLERGALRVDLSAVAAPWTIVAPLVEVSSQRGQFRLTASPGELRVAVQVGQVTMTRLPDRHTLTVEAGAAALMTETQALAIAPPPRPVALLLVGRSPGRREVDQPLEQRLEQLGYQVVQLADARLDRAALVDRALVVLSPSVSAVVLRERLPASGLREAPVPIVNCEIEAMPALGMTTATGMRRERLRVTMQETSHPLAAGLAGNVRVAHAPTALIWGRPSPAATVVASLEGAGPVLFGYDTGAAMIGLEAPARRASCFLSERAVLQASDAAWQLFDGSVQWVDGRK